MTTVDRSKEVELVRNYVREVERVVDGLGIRPRRFGLYPFDMMGLGLLSKAFAVTRAVFTLLDAGLDDEAFGLTRSLVECSLSLRYLTEDRDELWFRTDKYMRFAVADKQYWMHWALEHADAEMKAQILEYGRQWDLTPDTKGVSTHWSGKNGFAWRTNLEDHPLDGDKSTELGKKSGYAVDYYQTSSYVHCYSTALDNYWPSEFVPFKVNGERLKNPLLQRVLYPILGFMHSSIAYTLYGLAMERPQVLNNLHSETLQAIAPYERRFV